MTDNEPTRSSATERSSSQPPWLALRWPALILALAGLALFGYWLTLRQAATGARAATDIAGRAADRVEAIAEGFFTGDVTEQFVSSMPKVDRSAGGELEVAEVEIVETLTRSDERRLFWDTLSLGTTTVEVQVPVTYRYHVVLDDDWSVEVRGPVALVLAPSLRPTLPPALHTDRMRTRTEESWLRFDGADRLEELRASLTPRLTERAQAAGHVDLIREEARRRVAQFVRRWLLDQEFWTDDRFSTIKVIFPDEIPADVVPGEVSTVDEVDEIPSPGAP
ncbi:MAG: hypothetical protein MPN21_24540 [Thermoanaerobaculia bacterium]|nr:hypothetical protein [Thermoanaerobaculia bacterium]